MPHIKSIVLKTEEDYRNWEELRKLAKEKHRSMSEIVHTSIRHMLYVNGRLNAS